MTVIEIGARTSAPELANPLLTIEEAAQWLRIGRTLMFELVRNGDVETVTIGRLRRVPVECLTDYVARLRKQVNDNRSAA